MAQEGTENLPKIFDHIYWIGGSPCAGKSTVAALLAEKYNCGLYHCDEAYVLHQQHADKSIQPLLTRSLSLIWEEVWMRPVEEQVSSEFALYREEFALILADLQSLPNTQPIIAEGTALLPACVFPLLNSTQKSIWMVPAAEFQLAKYPKREYVAGILAQCSQPEQAFANWMERDRRFANIVSEEAEHLGLKVIRVDGHRSITALVREIEEHFQFV